MNNIIRDIGQSYVEFENTFNTKMMIYLLYKYMCNYFSI